MRIDRKNLCIAVVVCLVTLLSATSAHAASFTIGGTLSGLTSGASVTLLDNGTDALKLTANGKFTFATALPTGTAYKVTVSVQPTGETCTVTAGSGTVGTANVTTVAVSCVKVYTIGGTLSGLITGRTITLLDNGTDTLKLTANGKFTFAKALAGGAAYKVTISVQPTGETCTVTAGTGTVGTAAITTVVVACTPKTYTIGGTLSGLSTGASVTLLDNATDSLKLAANGKFTFAKAVASGAAYKVTVSVQPTGEKCTVTAGAGTVVGANITTVVVSCVKTYTIGGTLSGLITGRTVTLLDNAADSLALTANGKFTFKTALVGGAAYKVTVGTQPSGQTCTVTAGSGTVGTANVTTVVVACKANTYTIGGTLSGLITGRSVTLLDNGADALALTANGKFTFKTAVASGAAYKVTVGTQPSGQTCTVTAGSGTVVAANITTVVVTCKANTYTIGGTVSGLTTGASVTLLDNGADSLAVAANGSFTFKTAVASGATYSVTVGTPPTGETCTVTAGSGTVVAANITTVVVTCKAAATFTIGGTWIPYSASPIPGATPAGKNGLFLIPSDKLSSSPAPTFVSTDTTQLLGIGTQIAVTGGVAIYSPQVMMYGDIDSTGTTRIFGLTLAGTTTVPTPKQISNLALPSTQQICTVGASSETDVTQPTTLFVVIEVGTPAQCGAGGGSFEVVHYLDSATTAPVVVSINTTDINSVYQNGKLTGLLLYDSTSQSLDLYANNTFTSPTKKITGLSNAYYVSGVLDEATLSTTGLFFEVTTTTAVNYVYRIDGATQAAIQIQDIQSGSLGNAVQDDNNLYYIVLTPGASSSITATFYQVPLAGGTPKLLYTAPVFTSSVATAVTGYQLIGSNDSVLAFEFYSNPYTTGLQDPTKSTAKIYSVPVGATTTTPTTLANYTAGNQVYEAFLSTPSGGALSSAVLFAAIRNATGALPFPTITYDAASIPLNGGTPPALIANSAYLPLAIISARLTNSVWQVTGITDKNGGFGGGTANAVNVATLADTPLTTTGGGHYVFSAGFTGSFFAISSNNIALGFLNNSAALTSGTGTLQEDGAAADLSKNFFYPVILTNTFVVPY